MVIVMFAAVRFMVCYSLVDPEGNFNVCCNLCYGVLQCRVESCK